MTRISLNLPAAQAFVKRLRDEDMDAISGLDRGEDGRNGPNPDKFDYIPR